MTEQLAGLKVDLLPFLQMVTDHAHSDVYAERFEKRNGGNGYTPVKKTLDRPALERHLNGGPHIGVYLMDPGPDVTRIAVLDLDDHDGSLDPKRMFEAAHKIEDELARHGLRPLRVRSGGGRGIHLLLCWEAAQSAAAVRANLGVVLQKCGLKSGTGGVSNGEIEIFPKQDRVPEGKHGNLIALPFGRRSVPLDENFELVAVPSAWPPSEPVKALPTKKKKTRTEKKRPKEDVEIDQLSAALEALPADDYDEWIKVGLALKNHDPGDAGFELWDTYSKKSDKYPGEEELRHKWEGFEQRPDGVTIGSIFHMAREAGWTGRGASDERPQIQILPGNLAFTVKKSAEILRAAGAQIYRRGPELIRVATAESLDFCDDEIRRPSGSLMLVPAKTHWLLVKFSENVRYMKWVASAHGGEGGLKQTDAPIGIAQALQATADTLPFPELRGIARHPVFRLDGSIADQPGYDPKTRLLLDFGPGEFPAVPEAPSQADAREALKKLDDVTKHFPFCSTTDRAVAFSAVLTAIARPALPAAPLHAFDAPVPGSGKLFWLISPRSSRQAASRRKRPPGIVMRNLKNGWTLAYWPLIKSFY